MAELIHIERSILKKMDGGCQLPLGVYCLKDEDEFAVHVGFAHHKEGVAEVHLFQSEDPEVLIDVVIDELKNA